MKLKTVVHVTERHLDRPRKAKSEPVAAVVEEPDHVAPIVEARKFWETDEEETSESQG